MFLRSVQVCVIFVTFLLLGEEENALIGGYLSLYPETRKSHSVIPQTTTITLMPRVNLDCPFDCVDNASEN